MRRLTLALALLTCLAAALLFAPVTAQTPNGVPPRVNLVVQPGNTGGREIRLTINNDATAVGIQIYNATQAHQSPATPPRMTCGWPATGYATYRGHNLVCFHSFSAQLPADVYYVVEEGTARRRWGPYTLPTAGVTEGTITLEGPQSHQIGLPLLER